MATTLENLRNLSKKHRDRVARARDIAEAMKANADAAAKATAQQESATP